jgi:hypothetical protein
MISYSLVIKGFTILLSLIIFHSYVLGQKSYRDSVIENYEKRIHQTHINGVYIPMDVDDAMKQLDKLIDKASREKYKSTYEVEAVRNLHFSFGLWMIVNWGFYEGSRLSHSLKSMGISYPDDMARTLMICYHRRLNGKPFELENLASYFSKTRKEDMENRLNEGEVIHREPVKNKP